MPYLFQVSIGPVQSFIKAARRPRDLKFGSWFLSDVSREVARVISKERGKDSLIFPAMSAGELEDIPNKILADIKDSVSPSELAEKIKQAIDGRVAEIRDAVWQKISEPFDRVNAEKQIADLVEYIWVAVPYDPNKYGQGRQELEALLAARKNTRDFKAVSWGGPQPKSSIDGQLECVIPQTFYPDLRRFETLPNDQRSNQHDKIQTLRQIFGAGPHERLSGVDLLKRLGSMHRDSKEELETFPSTSHMAALPFLHRLASLDREKVEKWKTKYIDELKNIDLSPGKHRALALDLLPKSYVWDNDYFSLGRYDGSLLYPERFPEMVGDSKVYRAARDKFEEAIKTLETFCKDNGVYPNPYYVLLTADGDSMGKVIDHQARANDGMAQHKALSRALAGFAMGVAGIVQEYDGVCVYSGGDDALALLPIHTAVACATELATAFYKALETFTDEDRKTPTLSVGLAVVHHLHPLGDALEIARKAEQRAKKGDKNALAITVQKRGGPPCEVGGRWNCFNLRLQRQIEMCKSGIIPSGMAYELREISLRLEAEWEVPPDAWKLKDDKKDGSKLSEPHVQYAALRIFQRKLSEAARGKHEKRKAALTLYALEQMIGLDEKLEERMKKVQKMLDLKDEDTASLKALREDMERCRNVVPVSVGKLADELVVARLFANVQEEAGEAIEEGVQ